MSETQEVIKKLDEALHGVHEANRVVKENTGRLDSLENDKIQRIADETTDALQKVHTLNAAQEETTKQLALIAQTLDHAGSGKTDDRIVTEYSNELNKYLRYGIHMENDVEQKMVDHIVQKQAFGLTVPAMEKYKAELFRRKDLVSGINPDGGYWIQPERLAERITRDFETTPLMQVATIRNTANQLVEMIIDDEEFEDGGWVGETDPRNVTGSAQIGTLEIKMHEVFAEPRATQVMLDDAGFDIEGWISQKIANKLSRTVNTGGVLGDSPKSIRGFLTFPNYTTPGVYQREAVEQISSGDANTFTYNGLVEIQNSVKDRYQGNAIWMMNRRSFSEILKIKSLDDVPLINPFQLAEDPKRVLLGKPVLFAEDIPVVSAGVLGATYGDMSAGYMLVNRFGIRTIRDSITEKGFVKFYTTRRVGGTVTSYESFKIQKIEA